MPTRSNFTNAEKEYLKEQKELQKEKKKHHFYEGFTPEEKKPKMVRPPAIYSNPNWNEIYRDEYSYGQYILNEKL